MLREEALQLLPDPPASSQSLLPDVLYKWTVAISPEPVQMVLDSPVAPFDLIKVGCRTIPALFPPSLPH